MVAGTDTAARAAEHAGGRTVVPSSSIAIGRVAAVADPEGAAFCLFEGETDP
jgi:predicted enzyme related to lactoylglutathione lyase